MTIRFVFTLLETTDMIPESEIQKSLTEWDQELNRSYKQFQTISKLTLIGLVVLLILWEFALIYRMVLEG